MFRFFQFWLSIPLRICRAFISLSKNNKFIIAVIFATFGFIQIFFYLLHYHSSIQDPSCQNEFNDSSKRSIQNHHFRGSVNSPGEYVSNATIQFQGESAFVKTGKMGNFHLTMEKHYTELINKWIVAGKEGYFSNRLKIDSDQFNQNPLLICLKKIPRS